MMDFLETPENRGSFHSRLSLSILSIFPILIMMSLFLRRNYFAQNKTKKVEGHLTQLYAFMSVRIQRKLPWHWGQFLIIFSKIDFEHLYKNDFLPCWAKTLKDSIRNLSHPCWRLNCSNSVGKTPFANKLWVQMTRAQSLWLTKLLSKSKARRNRGPIYED